MAGIWERIRGDAEDRIDVHLFADAVAGYIAGTYTAQQIIDGLNSKLETPLTAAEKADLEGIATVINALTTTEKLLYHLKVLAVGRGAENLLITETKFRTELGI